MNPFETIFNSIGKLKEVQTLCLGKFPVTWLKLCKRGLSEVRMKTEGWTQRREPCLYLARLMNISINKRPLLRCKQRAEIVLPVRASPYTVVIPSAPINQSNHPGPNAHTVYQHI